MKAWNEAVEGARAFADFKARLQAGTERLKAELIETEEGCETSEPAAVVHERMPGENRAAHRARMKRERRATTKVKER